MAFYGLILSLMTSFCFYSTVYVLMTLNHHGIQKSVIPVNHHQTLMWRIPDFQSSANVSEKNEERSIRDECWKRKKTQGQRALHLGFGHRKEEYNQRIAKLANTASMSLQTVVLSLWGFVSPVVPVTMWGFVSAREIGEANSTSGPGSSEGRSSLVPWFPRLLLLEVPGATTEQVRTCGFKRNSSSFDKAPKIRDSVLLNSFDSFLVTLPSISSETWEMYSWVSSGSRTFGALPLLVFSGVSLETAANFLLFLNVAIKLGKRFSQRWRLNFLLYFLYSNYAPLLIRGKSLF